ncbi:hypothetical protein F4677DRAFT_414413 [Hypoxylon crocopeplum]|nr:hypothetical protein F4677DRAFT_414413 [Hypoxylon crocopeplum]
MSPLPAKVDQAAQLPSRFARTVLRLLGPRDDDDAKCHPQPNIDLCEKPVAANDATPIVLGVLGGVIVVATISVLLFLHFRRKRRDDKEWPKNNQELDDYGIGPLPTASNLNNAAAPKPRTAYRAPRVEPDSDNENDPYQPPPNTRRDSLQSLARSLRGNPDAYRPRRDDTSVDMKPVEPTSQL